MRLTSGSAISSAPKRAPTPRPGAPSSRARSRSDQDMSLTLYFHPLASFCHKVLIALYENDTRFTGQLVDLMDQEASARFFAIWPVGKMPVLRDDSRDRTIPETSIIIEYLDRHYRG